MNSTNKVFQLYKGIVIGVLVTLLVTGLAIIASPYLSNDNYSPELNPFLSFIRYLLSPAWRVYRAWGYAGETEFVDVFRSFFYLVTSALIGKSVGGGFLYGISLAFGAVFTGLLSVKLVNKFKQTESVDAEARDTESFIVQLSRNALPFLLGGLFYSTTLWTVWITYEAIAPFTIMYGVLPMVIYYFSKDVEKASAPSKLILFIVSTLFASTAVISTQSLVAAVLVPIMSVLLVNQRAKDQSMKLLNVDLVKRLLVSSLLFLTVQLLWILPMSFYTLGNSQSIVDSRINRAITSNVIDLERANQDLANSSTLYTRLLAEQRGSEDIFPLADRYQQDNTLLSLRFIPVIFAIIGIIIGLFKRQISIILLSVIGIALLYIIKVDNAPGGEIFRFLSSSIPLFAQVFRWPVSKVGTPYLLILALLATYGSFAIINLIKTSLKGKLARGIGASVFLLILFFLQFYYANFYYNGNLVNQKAQVEVPAEYYELADYLSNSESTGRILYLPPANNGYFREYKWGFYGSQFLSYVIANPIVDYTHTIGSSSGERSINELYDSYRSRDFTSMLALARKYNIDYILFDESVIQDGFTFSTADIDSQELKSQLSPVYQSDNLELYRIPEQESPTIVTEVLAGTSFSNDYFELPAARQPIINPLKFAGEGFIRNGEYLKLTKQYRGSDLTLVSKHANEEVQQYPTKVQFISTTKVIVKPALPFIGNQPAALPTQEYRLTTPAEYISINGYIMEVVSGAEYFIDIPYSTVDEVRTILKSSRSYSLRSEFEKLSALNCSGYGKEVKGELSKSTDGNSFELSGQKGEPCAVLPIYGAQFTGLWQVTFNWETAGETVPGVCIFSKSANRCLNSEKYVDVYSDKSGSVTFRANELANGLSDSLSLIFYATAPSNPSLQISGVELRVFSLGPVVDANLVKDGDKEIINYASFVDGEDYTVNIPIVKGRNSYVYEVDSQFNLYENRDAESINIEKYAEYASIALEKGYFDISKTLFKTELNEEYLVYWDVENLENIPATFCINSDLDNDCIIYDVATREARYSNLIKFNRQNNSELVNLYVKSSSYKDETVNNLYNLIFMRIPKGWNSITYSPIDITQSGTLTVNRLAPIGDANFSTIYNEKFTNTAATQLITINQASDSGWLLIYKNQDGWRFAPKEMTVLVNGWEMGWDLSDQTDIEEVTIIYWPNLLVQILYVLHFGLFLILVYSVILQSNKAKLLNQKNG